MLGCSVAENQEQGVVFKPGCIEAASVLVGFGVHVQQALTGLCGRADRDEGAGMEGNIGQQGLG